MQDLVAKQLLNMVLEVIPDLENMQEAGISNFLVFIQCTSKQNYAGVNGQAFVHAFDFFAVVGLFADKKHLGVSSMCRSFNTRL